MLVEDGGIIVLGGLISDEVRESKQQVPFLGSIPLLGELFKTRSVDKVKTNLMVFIRPRILRDGVDAAIETNAKYNYIRDQQLGYKKGKVPLMPGERQPTLPALETAGAARAARSRRRAPSRRVPRRRAQAGERRGVRSDDRGGAAARHRPPTRATDRAAAVTAAHPDRAAARPSSPSPESTTP